MFDVYCYKGTLAWRHEIYVRQRSRLLTVNNYKLQRSIIYTEVSESKPVGEVITTIETACPYYFRKSFLIGHYCTNLSVRYKLYPIKGQKKT